ncbi:MAG: response regulator [Opitutales bacterium]
MGAWSQSVRSISMDVQMPVMDGIEVTKRILEGSLEEDQPSIIAMTADATELDRNECQDS